MVYLEHVCLVGKHYCGVRSYVQLLSATLSFDIYILLFRLAGVLLYI